MHTPVFLRAVLEALQIQDGDKYIDCTAGEGGHLKSIAERGGKVLGIDYDAAQIKALVEQIQLPNVTLVNGNFKNIDKIAKLALKNISAVELIAHAKKPIDPKLLTRELLALSNQIGVDIAIPSNSMTCTIAPDVLSNT